MPFDKYRIMAVHEEVRSYFKAQPKSMNKVYVQSAFVSKPVLKPSPAGSKVNGAHWKIVPNDEKKHHRNQSAAHVFPILMQSRGQFDFHNTSLAEYGHYVLSQAQRLGNCYEMASAAAYLTLLRDAGTPWEVSFDGDFDHSLIVVTDGREPTVDKVGNCRLQSFEAWVIDPWANVCCRLQEYEQEFTVQMKQWSKMSKAVQVADSMVGGTYHLQSVNPSSPAYLDGIRNAELEYTKVTGPLPMGLPIAVKLRKEPARMPGEDGRWSAHDNWSDSEDWSD